MRGICRGGRLRVVIGVDYPLSPEHKYPVALDRIEALMLWLVAHGATLGIDPARIAMGGDSAGANLCVATALRLRARRGRHSSVRSFPTMALFHARGLRPCRGTFRRAGSIMDRAEAQGYYANYLVDSAAGAQDPFACPIHAELSFYLPPVLLVIPECDPVDRAVDRDGSAARSRGRRYRRRASMPGRRTAFWRRCRSPRSRARAIRDGAAFIRRRPRRRRRAVDERVDPAFVEPRLAQDRTAVGAQRAARRREAARRRRTAPVAAACAGCRRDSPL
ncbi:hypothetical protein OUZ56_027546 [Daphnia magna]|uniref:Alpha/beta hydrolase fold-3 domain-containing protein n=1 Tax=Daphnia magna TaxID=35525 RepID=A0ABQ9ZQ37_9CRUS|nr:hypothetical protein OUZ56_027546 [Daphnia magna]